MFNLIIIKLFYLSYFTCLVVLSSGHYCINEILAERTELVSVGPCRAR